MAELLPVWLNGKLNEKDLAAISDAVSLAESKTEGEIVPMIVGSSSFASHVPLEIAVIVFAFLILFVPLIQWHLAVSALILDALITVVSLGAAFVLVRVPAVRRALIPWNDRVAAVARRAQLEFYQTGIPHTHGRTGVLIFVSLFERRAVILGDEAISSKLKEDAWVSIISEMLLKFGRGNMRLGLISAIEDVGEILAREFPALAHNQNELPNTLIVKD